MDDRSEATTSRRAILTGLCRGLCAGPRPLAEIEAAKPALEGVEAEDVVVAVDALVSEGLPMKDLEAGVSRLLNLLKPVLSRGLWKPDEPFFASLVEENAAILARLASFRPHLVALNAGLEGGPAARQALAKGLVEFAAVELHYVKKENILFPWFEARYPSWRCLSVMWSLHDAVRAELRALPSILEAGDLPSINASFGRLFFAVHSLAFREDRILYPVIATAGGHGLLTRSELLALWRESQDIGYALLDGAAMARIEALAGNGAAQEGVGEGREGVSSSPAALPGTAAWALAASRLSLDAGSLPFDALDPILKALPVDLTFVDAGDRVAWFTNGAHRVFPRSPSIIGRDVRNCHPPASVGRVLSIIEAFRKGEREVEDFWLESKGRFVFIRYTAIRGTDGAYLGTLEASQDLTELRALSGEKRLASP